jgi:hypothetical protein
MTRPRFARTAEFAWPGGDRPGEIGFEHPVAPELAGRILARLGGGAGAVKAMSPPNGVLGRYHVATGGADWFVRITGRWAHPALEQALTGFLRERGVSVNHLEIAGAEFAEGGLAYRFDARRLLRARHFADSLEDLRAVAATLAAAHRALRDFPRTDEVGALSARRFGALEAVLPEIRRAVEEQAWSRLARDAAWGAARAEWLREMVARADLRFDREPEAQCLHAQMHRGNVLFAQPAGAPVLIDLRKPCTISPHLRGIRRISCSASASTMNRTPPRSRRGSRRCTRATARRSATWRS